MPKTRLLLVDLSPFKEQILFLCLLAAEFLLCGLLAAWHRIPAGHDGSIYFASQYYFLNNTIACGEIPQWLPFMAQGMNAYWWYAMQGSLVQNLSLLGGSLFKGIPFLALFHGGIFVDTALFLVGTWFLAKRFFRSSEAAFFVAAASSGSLIWATQPCFNFHFIFAIPLILHFLHSFLETRRWRYFFLAGNLFTFQMVCNVSYFFLVTSLVIALYFLFYALLNRQEIREGFSSLTWGRPFWATALSLLAGLAGAYLLFKMGTATVAIHGSGRTADGTVTLATFLTYGGGQGWGRWIELAFGISPAMDYTLYLGIFSLPFAAMGLFHLNRKRLHFFILAATMLAFGMGTAVSTFFYHAWPAMKFYRHIGLTACFVKFFLCFLAGAGFDAACAQGSKGRPRLTGALCLLFFALLTPFLFRLADNPSGTLRLLENLYAGDLWEKHVPFLRENLLGLSLRRTAWFGLAGIFPAVLWLLPRFRRFARQAVLLVLLLHGLDLYSYKAFDALGKTIPLSNGQMELVRYQPLPYASRRTPLAGSADKRPHLFFQLPLLREITWMTQSFLFHDEAGSSLRIDYWERPLDRLMKAYWGQAWGDVTVHPAGLVRGRGLVFPSKHPAAGKASGTAEDKIQFFSQAYLFQSEEEAARKMTDPEYAGDILFLSHEERPLSLEREPPVWTDNLSLASNSRLAVPYRVTRFDSNHLEFTVTVPGGKPAWAFYSDVWHPFWKAKVNGRPVPVARANLAYK
ncbi:MAG: hypothetical protein HYS41_04150, partial [Candidatus Omnitrophica bacterium]|nr:hypothetical protein [Candidatus Omnitrophota bacterium]